MIVLYEYLLFFLTCSDSGLSGRTVVMSEFCLFYVEKSDLSQALISCCRSRRLLSVQRCKFPTDLCNKGAWARVCAWSCVCVVVCACVSCHCPVVSHSRAETGSQWGKKSNDDFKIIAHITKSSLIFWYHVDLLIFHFFSFFNYRWHVSVFLLKRI